MTRLTLVLLALCVALVSVDADQFRIRVGRPPTPVGGDTTPPVVTITSPTSASTFNTSTTPLTTLAGTASDNVGVVSCSWSSSNGGSGSTTGTTSWSVPSIALATNSNTVIEVVCVDAASNQGSDTLTVTHSTGPPPGGGIDSYFSSGTTRAAANCSVSAVQAAVNLSTHGDTVTVPPCAATSWSTQLTVTVGIRLQGAGIDTTTLTDAVNKDGASGTTALMQFSVNTPNAVQITGFTIQGDGRSATQNTGHVVIGGTATAFRINHNKFQTLHTAAIRIAGPFGVIDNNDFFKSFDNGVIVHASGWGGSNYGDGSWAAATTFGSSNAVYLENNYFTDSSTPPGSINDCGDGGRVVSRFNEIDHDYMQGHGTDSGQRRRGCRQLESYHNTFTNRSSIDTGHFWASGAGVIFNNAIIGGWWNTFAKLVVRRQPGFTFPPWGSCDGSSPYDGNTSGGYPCIDQPGRGQGIHFNGDSSGTNGAPLPAQWAGNAQEPIYAWGNTGTNNLAFGVVAGDTATLVAINRDYHSQQDTACVAGGACTKGVGVGTTLPTSCTTGAAFWKTNEGGNWWTTGGGADDGRLYKCTATNTWTAIMTPLTFPHPLAAGS
jgi:hypothetical protein